MQAGINPEALWDCLLISSFLCIGPQKQLIAGVLHQKKFIFVARIMNRYLNDVLQKRRNFHVCYFVQETVCRVHSGVLYLILTSTNLRFSHIWNLFTSLRIWFSLAVWGWITFHLSRRCWLSGNGWILLDFVLHQKWFFNPSHTLLRNYDIIRTFRSILRKWRFSAVARMFPILTILAHCFLVRPRGILESNFVHNHLVLWSMSW
jgi:hypothetical protein